MKRILLVTFLLCIAAAVNAQVTLNLYGGYNFKDKINFDRAYCYFNDGFQWGGGLEYEVVENQSIELKYLRMDTHVPIYKKVDNVQLNPNNTKAAVNYILFGGNHYFGYSKDKVTPFISGSLGVGILEGNQNSSTKFAWDIKSGVRIKTNSAITLKLHAYLQSVISTFGTDYWVGYWGYVYAVPDYKTLLQFGLGGAISFDFGKKK